MPSIIHPTHQDFHWIDHPTPHPAFADFVELTRDISAGINTCLQVIFSSNLAREQNKDAEPECETAPAIGKTDAANLCRLSMAANKLLLAAAQDRIDHFNAQQEK